MYRRRFGFSWFFRGLFFTGDAVPGGGGEGYSARIFLIKSYVRFTLKYDIRTARNIVISPGLEKRPPAFPSCYDNIHRIKQLCVMNIIRK